MRRRVTCGMVLLLLAACASGPPLPDYRGLSPQEARAEILRNSRDLADLSASVDLSIDSGEWQGTLGGALLMRPPGYLRLRAFKLFQEVFDLVVTPESVELLVFRDNVLYRDRTPLDDPRPRAPTGSPLDGIDGRAIRLAIGRFELPPEEEESDLVVSERVVREQLSAVREQLQVVSELQSGEKVIRRFDVRTLFLESVELSHAGEPKLRARYTDYELLDGAWLPTRMELQDLSRDNTFALQLSDIELNQGALPGDFVLRPDSSTRIRSVGR